MLDWSNIQRLSGRRADVAALETPDWEGSFDEYLLLFAQSPGVARSSLRRVRDMLSDPGGAGGSFASAPGLTDAVESLSMVALDPGAAPSPKAIVLSAAEAAPVARLGRSMTEALARYASSREGALFTLQWRFGEGEEPPGGLSSGTHPCPFGEDPLRLIPEESRRRLVADVLRAQEGAPALELGGPLCPFCRGLSEKLLRRHHGDWSRVVAHVRVRRHSGPLGTDIGGGLAGEAGVAPQVPEGGRRGLVALPLPAEDPAQLLARLLGELLGPDVAPVQRDIVLLATAIGQILPSELPERLSGSVAVVRVDAATA
jgi:hypothetical protein